MPVQLSVKIFSIAAAQRQPHTKTQYTVYFCINAILQYSLYIFFGVVDKRKYRRQPYHCGDAVVPQDFQNFYSALCRAYVGLQLLAQLLVVCRQSHLHNALCLLVYTLQQIQIAKYQIRLGYHRKSKTVTLNQLQRLLHVAKFCFKRYVRIRH